MRLELTKILCNGAILLYEVRLPKPGYFAFFRPTFLINSYLRNLTIKSEIKCRTQLRSLLGWYAGGTVIRQRRPKIVYYIENGKRSTFISTGDFQWIMCLDRMRFTRLHLNLRATRSKMILLLKIIPNFIHNFSSANNS